MAVRCRVGLIFSAQLSIRNDRLTVCGIERHNIVLFQLARVDLRTVFDDRILRRNPARGRQTVNKRVRSACCRFRQDCHQLQHTVLVVVQGQRVAGLQVRPCIFVLIHGMVAADIQLSLAVRTQCSVRGNDTICFRIDNLIGFGLVAVRNHTDRNLAVALADNDCAVHTDHAAVQRTGSLTGRFRIHNTVLIEQCRICSKAAVCFSGLKQNAVLDRRGRDLVKQCAALFSLFIRIQSVQQKHRRISALDRGTRIRNRDTVRQTDGLCLRDIVCRPERTDILLFIPQHTQQHGADLTVADNLIRAEAAVRIAADDGLFLQLRMAYCRVDIRRCPVRMLNIRKNRVAGIRTHIRHTHGGNRQLAELRPRQRLTRREAAAAYALHDTQCIQNGGRLRYPAV